MKQERLVHAGIDAKEGIRRFNNRTDMYEHYLMDFPNDPTFAELVNALEAQDAHRAFIAAHTLKGIAGNLSLIRLHADLIPLVELCRSHPLDQYAPLLAQIRRDYNEIVSALAAER